MTRIWTLIAVVTFSVNVNTASAMIEIAWSPTTIGGVQVTRAAMLLPVRVSGCAASSGNGFYMQFDTGQSRSVIYRSGLDELSRRCGVAPYNPETQDAVNLRIHVDELLLDREWIVYGEPLNKKPARNAVRQPILLGSLGIDAIANAFAIIDGGQSKFVATRATAKFTSATRGLIFHPFEVDESGRLLVCARIRGFERPLKLMLDTGAASQNVVVKKSVFTDLERSGALLGPGTEYALGGWGKIFNCQRKQSLSELFALESALFSRDITSCQTDDSQSNSEDFFDGVLGLGGMGQGFLLAINLVAGDIAVSTRDVVLLPKQKTALRRQRSSR